jgi:hypothetical protein
MPITELGLKGNIPSLLCGDGIGIVLLMDLRQNPTLAPFLIAEVETLIPSWAISNAFAHLTSTSAWDKWVASDQILEIWISPFVL